MNLIKRIYITKVLKRASIKMHEFSLKCQNRGRGEVGKEELDRHSW